VLPTFRLGPGTLARSRFKYLWGVSDKGMEWTRAEPGYIPPEIDMTTPNVARIYDYWLGGKDNISQEVRADFRNRDRT